MVPNREYDIVKHALGKLSKDDLVQLILERVTQPQAPESLPLSVFTTGLPPLEAAARYLKESGKKTSEIATILGRAASSVSQAIKNATGKPFEVKETDVHIPYSAFSVHPKLSVLESVVYYLKSQGRRLTDIAVLLGRDPKTIWTLNSRATKKIGGPTMKKSPSQTASHHHHSTKEKEDNA